MNDLEYELDAVIKNRALVIADLIKTTKKGQRSQLYAVLARALGDTGNIRDAQLLIALSDRYDGDAENKRDLINFLKNS